jgi:hypothetical protein
MVIGELPIERSIASSGYRPLLDRSGEANMSSISRFYGIVVSMYSNDHPPPHFHARYGEYEAKIDIATCQVQAGDLPVRAWRLIREWADLHREELWADWELAQERKELAKIDPLP